MTDVDTLLKAAKEVLASAEGQSRLLYLRLGIGINTPERAWLDLHDAIVRIEENRNVDRSR